MNADASCCTSCCQHLALESRKRGPSEAQPKFLADMEAAGAFVCVAVGLDRALAVLEQWGLLRGQTQ
jgi:hypothetical protein